MPLRVCPPFWDIMWLFPRNRAVEAEGGYILNHAIHGCEENSPMYLIPFLHIRAKQASWRDFFTFCTPYFIHQLNTLLKAKIILKSSGSKCNIFICMFKAIVPLFHSNVIGGHSRHHCKSHTTWWPFCFQMHNHSYWIHSSKVVLEWCSLNLSNWLVTAWDAECSLQPLSTDVRGKTRKNAWQMAHSNDVREFIFQETTVDSCSFAGDFCHIKQDSKS